MTARRLVALILIGLPLAGCGPEPVDARFDRSRGPSINGTSALVALFRRLGNDVRISPRLDGLEDWADVVVRFAPHPGPPDEKEGRRLLAWLQSDRGNRLVYVPHDYDAAPEFWSAVLAAKAKDADPKWVAQVEKNRDRARGWESRLPSPPKTAAPASEWFAIEPDPGKPAVVAELAGDWAEGVDAKAAALTRHETFHVQGETPLLADADGRVLAMSWTFDNGASVLAIANGSFLLNAALLVPARRPLALRVAEWAAEGEGDGDGKKHVAFLNGDKVAEPVEPAGEMGLFHLLTIFPFDWIAAHLAALGLLAALARAVRLGRPRPEPPTGVDRPAAHPEALGGLLARTRRPDVARELLDAYRRWRHPATSSPSSRVHPP